MDRWIRSGSPLEGILTLRLPNKRKRPPSFLPLVVSSRILFYRHYLRLPVAMPPTPSPRCDSPSFKVALALALIRFNRIHRPSPSFSSDAQRWKRKAKDRKLEILRLREELKQLEGILALPLPSDDLFVSCFLDELSVKEVWICKMGERVRPIYQLHHAGAISLMGSVSWEEMVRDTVMEDIGSMRS
ncbi:hypothetical protein BHM03_00034426 [Ensete ventricosum]|nr:hypothetical protein BHM03_00034426 [Ensete ventricosum]